MVIIIICYCVKVEDVKVADQKEVILTRLSTALSLFFLLVNFLLPLSKVSKMGAPPCVEP